MNTDNWTPRDWEEWDNHRLTWVFLGMSALGIMAYYTELTEYIPPLVTGWGGYLYSRWGGWAYRLGFIIPPAALTLWLFEWRKPEWFEWRLFF